jgi:hypothetical protein
MDVRCIPSEDPGLISIIWTGASTSEFRFLNPKQEHWLYKYLWIVVFSFQLCTEEKSRYIRRNFKVVIKECPKMYKWDSVENTYSYFMHTHKHTHTDLKKSHLTN